MTVCSLFLFFFFFNDTATTEIYTLSLHDALPICWAPRFGLAPSWHRMRQQEPRPRLRQGKIIRSEEHTSELQSRLHLVCRLLLEKKKKKKYDKLDASQSHTDMSSPTYISTSYLSC